MALRPEPMQRALIVSSKAYQPAIIETLHAMRAAHFIDFSEQKEGEFSEFKLGKPLPEADAASAHLVRLRALLRHLGLEGAFTDATISARELESALDAKLNTIEADVTRAVETRESVRNSLQEGKEREAKLAPLTALPLKLEDYAGYDSLSVFTGRADRSVHQEIPRVAPDHLLVTSEGDLFALFVPKARAAEVSELLYKNGFTEVEVPAGAGSPDEQIREIVSQRSTLESRLAKADAEIQRLASEHKTWLLAAEEHLAIQVEKAEAPLAFASTENAFIIDTWIPMHSVPAVESAIKTATRDNAHFERLETSDEVAHDEAHHHDHDHGGADSAFNAHANHAAPKALPPTRYDNGAAAKRFEWFTDLFSTPRYNEVDPTAIFAIFFPLFFGFMIGDLGLGLIIIGIGWLLMTKLPRVDGMKQLGTALLIAGIIAAVLGGFVFKDALGIPLGFNSHADEELAKAGLAPACTSAVYKALSETNWGCMLGGNVWHAEPIVNKVQDLNTLLLLSVLAGLVHLFIGLSFGIKNEWGHGGKHLAAKFGYMILLLTFFPAVTALLRKDMFADGTPLTPSPALTFAIPITTTQAYMTAGVGFVLGAIILGWAEGFGGVLEIPSMFSAIMSYLRLGAVAIAKGAMAIAFNNLTLIAALTGGGLILVIGLIGFVIAQIALLVLGLLSGGIQALRLNFVEFFTKFYKGGGTPYKPFGRTRQYTAASTSAPPAGAAVSSVMLKP